MKEHSHSIEAWDKDAADALYGVSKWGAGYFAIGDNGNLCVTPDIEKPHMQIDFASVISDIQQANIQFPVVVRFHDVPHKPLRE